jgi:hypothetical protein
MKQALLIVDVQSSFPVPMEILHGIRELSAGAYDSSKCYRLGRAGYASAVAFFTRRSSCLRRTCRNATKSRPRNVVESSKMA